MHPSRCIVVNDDIQSGEYIYNNITPQISSVSHMSTVIHPECGNEMAVAGRDGRKYLARPKSHGCTGTGKNHISCLDDHQQDWQPYPVDPYSTFCGDLTYIYTYFQRAYFILMVVGVGKRGTHYLVHGNNCKGSTHHWNYLGDYWTCAGGLSAVNTIRMQWHDTMNSGLARWCMVM